MSEIFPWKNEEKQIRNNEEETEKREKKKNKGTDGCIIRNKEHGLGLAFICLEYPKTFHNFILILIILTKCKISLLYFLNFIFSYNFKKFSSRPLLDSI